VSEKKKESAKELERGREMEAEKWGEDERERVQKERESGRRERK
jgi:hypothetical protein